MATYLVGNVIQETGTFTTTATGVPADPTAVTFTYQITVNAVPGAPTVFTYSGASTPAPGILARTSTGVYPAQILLSTAGYYEWEIQGTGSNAAAAAGSFLVEPLPI